MLAPEIEILNINAFNYSNPISEKLINRLYMGAIKRTPQIWNYLYDNPKIVKKTERLKELIHKFNSPKLKKLFNRFKPDILVCTQAFPCGMCADYKKEYNSNIPLIAVLTDYIPHSYWLYDRVNYYITPSEDVSQRLIKKGVPLDKVVSFGIPVDPKFNLESDKNSLLQKFKLNPSLPVILIMGGGQGLGPIKTIVKCLEKVKKEIQEVVVTGTNKKLYKKLKRGIKKYKKDVLVLSYVDNINELMSLSTLIISKPGGVTTAEVLTKNLPMVIVKPIPGQEASNADYLTEKGCAIKLDEPKQIHLAVEDLLNSPEKLNRIRESISRVVKPNSSFDIARFLLNL